MEVVDSGEVVVTVVLDVDSGVVVVTVVPLSYNEVKCHLRGHV